MTAWFDCSDATQRKEGLEAAVNAILAGELVVLPTDTVYGVGADAFTPAAVQRLLAAKGRGRDMPPPVLVGTVRAATALVEDLGQYGQQLIDEFWPGGLTLVCRSARTLSWDLGDSRGTVAIRMPEDPIALDLLRETGPMAVSSANLTGSPSATTAQEAREQLGDAAAVYLDGGKAHGGVASTIIDLTGPQPRLLRRGAISVGRLREVAAVVAGPTAETEAPAAGAKAPAPEADSRAAEADGRAAEAAASASRAEAPGAEAEAPVSKPAGRTSRAKSRPAKADKPA